IVAAFTCTEAVRAAAKTSQIIPNIPVSCFIFYSCEFTLRELLSCAPRLSCVNVVKVKRVWALCCHLYVVFQGVPRRCKLIPLVDQHELVGHCSPVYRITPIVPDGQ
ncbi:MAG: hypothetical protein OEV80_17500, partial [candidate division Zixibacteria bacterium]|nr:hypothetical protein [candidate division Zixibacteria bacterium]